MECSRPQAGHFYSPKRNRRLPKRSDKQTSYRCTSINLPRELFCERKFPFTRMQVILVLQPVLNTSLQWESNPLVSSTQKTMSASLRSEEIFAPAPLANAALCGRRAPTRGRAFHSNVVGRARSAGAHARPCANAHDAGHRGAAHRSSKACCQRPFRYRARGSYPSSSFRLTGAVHRHGLAQVIEARCRRKGRTRRSAPRFDSGSARALACSVRRLAGRKCSVSTARVRSPTSLRQAQR